MIRRLKEIPAGTRALFVNVTHQMAREAITQLEQSGVNQLQFIPYGPDVFTMEPTFGDDVVPENVKLAVTPDEMDFVPAGMEQVINIGHRPCTANTRLRLLCDWIRECNGRKKNSRIIFTLWLPEITALSRCSSAPEIWRASWIFFWKFWMRA